MSAPILPTPLAGPAGDYAEAMKQRDIEAAKWLGLDPSLVWDFGSNGLEVSWKSEQRTGLRPGPIRNAPRFAENPSWDGERYTISYAITLRWEDAEALRAHLGPPPQPAVLASIWNARAGDLTPGTKLYDPEGNVIGEVGRTIPAGALGGYGFLVTS